MIYPSTTILFALIPLVLSLTTPISPTPDTTPNLIERGDTKQRSVTIQMRGGMKGSIPSNKGDPEPAQLVWWNGQSHKWTRYDTMVFALTQKEWGGEKGKKEKNKVVESFYFRHETPAGIPAKNVSCTLELDQTVGWNNKKTVALFEFQKGDSYLGTCGFVEPQEYLRVYCPIEPATCDMTKWQ